MFQLPALMMKLNGRWLAKRDQGFTLFEVVVAGFVAILFFLLVLQASSLGTVSKAQAQEASEVLSWLQKDIETVKQVANSLQLSTVKAANKGSINVYLTNFDDEKKFKSGDIIEFITANPDGIRYTIRSANSPTTGYFRLAKKMNTTYPTNSIVHIVSRELAKITKISPTGSNTVYLTDTSKIKPGDKLIFSGLNNSSTNSLVNAGSASSVVNTGGIQEVSQENYAVNSVASGVVTLKKNLLFGVDPTNGANLLICNASSKLSGYGDALRDELIGVDESTDASTIILDNSLTQTSKGKKYTVKRVMEPVDIPPYNMLQVRYETNPTLSSMISLDSFVNRIMPDIVFYCN